MAKFFDPHAGVKRKVKQQKAAKDSQTYDWQWRKASKQFRIENPWCVECLAEGFVKESEHVDHIEPVVNRPDLRMDPSNWQVLCTACHSIKTAREMGWSKGGGSDAGG